MTKRPCPYTRELDDPTQQEDDPLEEDEPLSEDEDTLKLDVDSLEDVLTIVEECSETLDSLQAFISTQHREFHPHLQQLVTLLRRLAFQVGAQLPQTTNTTKSTKSLSPIGTPKMESDPTSRDNTSTDS